VDERTTELKTALSEIETMKDRLEAENIYFPSREQNETSILKILSGK